jgi:hypothetical protein
MASAIRSAPLRMHMQVRQRWMICLKQCVLVVTEVADRATDLPLRPAPVPGRRAPGTPRQRAAPPHGRLLRRIRLLLRPSLGAFSSQPARWTFYPTLSLPARRLC